MFTPNDVTSENVTSVRSPIDLTTET